MICFVVGARPNFMKIAPIVREAQNREIPHFLVHTGQHYDVTMSQVFFDELGMPEPDVYLNVGSDTHAKQTARIMIAFEQVCVEWEPNLVVVGGDVNSTLAVSLVAAKLHISVAHVEAGLRSFDRKMPEEFNRVLTDHISDFLFTTEPSGNENLLNEGITNEKIYYVGNTMIDTLQDHLESAIDRKPWVRYGLQPGEYAIGTLHRPSNVDVETNFREIMSAFSEIGCHLPILFPAHPRTKLRINEVGIRVKNIKVIPALGYLDFLGLMSRAKLVLTDSGGIQEETTALGVPCITIRENTERPITIEEGTNRLAGTSKEGILSVFKETLMEENTASVPNLWDGQASVRVMDIVERWLSYISSLSVVHTEAA